MRGFRWTGAEGVRLWLWRAVTVVREAGAQGGGGGEGSAAWQQSSGGERNASMHGKYFEAYDVHMFFCNLQMFVHVAWIFLI
jgi:hypothetical protein